MLYHSEDCREAYCNIVELLSSEAKASGTESLIFMDMGQHAIKDWPEPQLLHQVLVPGLEDRARLTPELNTFEQISTGVCLSAALPWTPTPGVL